MSVYLRLEPIPGSRTPFEPIYIHLAKEDEAFVIGFRLKSYGPGERQPGFSENLEDDKLCIIPLHSREAMTMEDPLGGIWLAPGYKVMLLPADDSKMYYQRAVEGNSQWTKIKKGWAFDLAEPLMHALDGAVNVKFDTRSERRREHFMRSLHDAFHPDHPAESHRSLARHLHTEITGARVHGAPRAHHIVARVTADWRPRGWVRPPSVRDRTPLPIPARLREKAAPEELARGLAREEWARVAPPPGWHTEGEQEHEEEEDGQDTDTDTETSDDETRREQYEDVYLDENTQEGLRKYAAALAARHARGCWPRAAPVPPNRQPQSDPVFANESALSTNEQEDVTEGDIALPSETTGSAGLQDARTSRLNKPGEIC